MVLNVNQVLQIDATVVTGMLILLTLTSFSQFDNPIYTNSTENRIEQFSEAGYYVDPKGLPLGNLFIASAIIPFAYSAFTLINVSLRVQKIEWKTFLMNPDSSDLAEKAVKEKLERKLRLSLITGLRMTSYGFIYLILAVIYFVIAQPIAGEVVLRW